MLCLYMIIAGANQYAVECGRETTDHAKELQSQVSSIRQYVLRNSSKWTEADLDRFESNALMGGGPVDCTNQDAQKVHDLVTSKIDEIKVQLNESLSQDAEPTWGECL